MDIVLYLNSDESDPRRSRVTSLTDMTGRLLPRFVYGTRLNLTIYLVTSAGAYHPSSGSAALAKRLALGPRFATALAYTETFTQITDGWTCTLDLTTTELAAFLLNATLGDLALEFSTTDVGPAKTVWATLPVNMLGAVADPASGAAIVPPAYYTAAEVDALFLAAADAYLFPSLMFFGAAALDQVFDYFKARVAVTIIGAQISAQSGPTGADLTVCLVDSAGAEIAGSTITLTGGATYQETIFGAALALAAGSHVRAKIKTTGSGQPGGYLNLKLIVRPSL